jgi:hypothetical protein
LVKESALRLARHCNLYETWEVMMMRVKVSKLGEGLHPSMVVVGVRTIHGTERLLIDEESLFENSVEIGWPVDEEKDRLLVELPNETLRGAWRVWVPRDEVIPPPRAQAAE